MNVLWLAMAAFAAPALDIAAGGAVALGDRTRDAISALGVRGAVELPREQMAFGGTAFVGVNGAGRPVGSLGPTLRVGRTERAPAVSVLASAGMLVDQGVTLVLTPGLAVDVGPSDGNRWRIQAGYRFAPLREAWWLELTVARLFRRRPEPERIWQPEPICAWLDPEASLEPFEASGAPATTEEAASGVLVVAAHPGDRVEIDGGPTASDVRGLVVRRVLGDVRAEIVGGGRRLVRELAISEDHALWWSVEPPEPLRIGFGQGVAFLDAAARSRLDAMVRDAGDWRFEVRGGFSPEGDAEANVDLAQARALAVARYLEGLGLDETRMSLSDVLIPSDVTAPEAQRVAVVVPVPPAGPESIRPEEEP